MMYVTHVLLLRLAQKKISFSLKYLITKYDWCFYFIPGLIVWKPYNGVYEINVGFLLWEFNIRIRTKKK